ncbi:MAG: hypothetical protein PHI27_08395 [Eubacteriales bacterium]|nr:hypothetical protein [Eubacteriales bacterium]MDD3882258.1 hypothetical protein [Eubacteriales bacterium]MDD4512004.1 hypothetical protein [Eubacteriales bacterium]
MNSAEGRLMSCLVEGMLETRFESKQEMAEALGVNEATLDSCGSFEVLDQLLHYCVRNVLPMESLLGKLIN